MDSDVTKIADHMNFFGQSLLGHSLEHSVFSAMGNVFWSAFGVLHAAQAAEILIKAAIAKEHPLLVFSELPKLGKKESDRITIEHLLEEGKTVQYSKLPDILCASTGYKIENLERYKTFGLLRNQIQHLAVPDSDLSKETLLFVVEVIDPLFKHFWNERVFDDLIVDDTYVYEEGFLKEALDEHGISYDG
jgi:hypothetical protein